MKTRDLVTIKKKWNNPEIHLWVNNDEIGMQIELWDFIEALKEELKSPALIFTRAELGNNINIAVERVLEEIKKESTKVVV
jgi:hypothetical protein